MASPFPGMDPYLEGEMWQEFHETLASEIRAQLLPQLRPKYVALLAKRYVIDRPSVSILDLPPEQRIIYPDIHVVEKPPRIMESVPAYTAAPILTPPSVRRLSLMEEEVPLLSIEIRDVAERRLVTVIEILSPVNKQGEGGRDYLNRRIELLKTSTHLLEIDLLRRGLRVRFDSDPPPAHYYVYLSRVQDRPYTDIWLVQLSQRLPTVPVPLLPPDDDVLLNLQAAVDACFELVEYEQLLNYTAAPPPPPLNEAETTWLEQTLRRTGLRPL